MKDFTVVYSIAKLTFWSMYISINISANTYFLTRKTNIWTFIFSENQIKNYNVVTSFRERSITTTSMSFVFESSSLITLFVVENFSMLKFRQFSHIRRGKSFVVENLRRGKFSSSGQNFITFPRRNFPR